MLLSESRSDVETFVAAFGAMPIYAERSCIALRLSLGISSPSQRMHPTVPYARDVDTVLRADVG